MTALHTTVAGPDDGAPVVLLHGFTQTSVSWAPISGALAGDRRVTRADMPGHGRSAALRLDLTATAAAVAGTCGRAAYVGYSMGGRVALRLALDHPALVEHLVLVGATAGIDDAPERARRRATDEERAQDLERDGVDAFLDRWLAQPLFAGLTPRPEDVAARRTNPASGLAASLRLSGTGTMDPPWWGEVAALGAAGIPTTVVVGERDGKFTDLGHRLVAGIGPTASLEVIPGTGHACHLEDPDAFVALLRRVLPARPAPEDPPPTP